MCLVSHPAADDKSFHAQHQKKHHPIKTLTEPPTPKKKHDADARVSIPKTLQNDGVT